MAHDAFLLEDGGKWLLEDGTGVFLLEDQSDPGVHLINTIQHQRADPYLPSKDRKIPVEFTFQILANTISRVKLKLTDFKEKLSPNNIYTDKLRESLKIPVTDLKKKISKPFKELGFRAILEGFDKDDWMQMCRELLRRMKK